MSNDDLQKIRDEIVTAALDLAVFDGWNAAMLARAAEDAGYSSYEIRAVFPSGVQSALDHFADMADRWMLEALVNLNAEDLRVRDRIREAVLARLHVLAPHKEAVKASLGFWSVPLRHGKAGKIVWRTADCIWTWAGDESQDYNYYTKRGLLSGILASTILVWCQDDTPEIKKTTSFLDARIQNVMNFGRIIGQLKSRKCAS